MTEACRWTVQQAFLGLLREIDPQIASDEFAHQLTSLAEAWASDLNGDLGRLAVQTFEIEEWIRSNVASRRRQE